MRTRRFISITIFGFLVISMLAFSMSASADFNHSRSYQADYQVCYAIADEGGVGSPGADRLTQITYVGGVNGQEMLMGDPGTTQIEAITFDVNLQGGNLYGADGGQLGVFDLENQGVFIPRPNAVGSGTGSLGTVTMTDIDGIAFQESTGFLYGSERREASNTQPDLLIRIDPLSGLLVKGAFNGQDYVPIQPTQGLYDIDDITFDPVSGALYAIANRAGRQDRLVIIDITTGAVTDVGPLTSDIDSTTIYDMEGLTFDTFGRLMGTTGKDGGGRSNQLWIINQATGLINESATAKLTLGRDYEGVSCLTSATVITVTPTVPVPPVTETPTSVELVSFDAQPGGPGMVHVTWVTATEIDNVAYTLYRAAENDRSRAMEIAVVPAAGNGFAGSSYSFDDRPPAAGEWWYWLEDVDSKGERTGHGPVSVQLRSVSQAGEFLYIPFLSAP